MLKIKDNVTLNELERFGFKGDIHIGCYYFIGNDKNSRCSIRVFEDRELEIFIDCNKNCAVYLDSLPSILFDLIKADLVEKVVKNEE